MMNIIIPMAGQGSRFKEAGFDLPKPLISINGKTLAQHSIDSLGIGGRFIFITRTFDNPEHNEVLTKIFEDCCDNFLEIRVDGEHLGAAHTALFAEKYVDKDDGLILTNCDQILEWDADAFMSYINEEDPDGVVMVYKDTGKQHSFARMDHSGYVIEIAEKRPISDNALTGFHYWKSAGLFFDSARSFINDYQSAGYPEAYVAPTYQYLIDDGKLINAWFLLGSERFISLGTPEAFDQYLETLADSDIIY
jgi:dTDP-glucose pyrophosphorylase